METLMEISASVASNYTLEDAARDAKHLHRLAKEALSATALLDDAVKELRAEMQMLEDRRAEILSPINDEMDRLKNNLVAYHQGELANNDNNKTIKLPYATLQSRLQPQDYGKDDAVLLGWVKEHATEYIKETPPTVAWGELKKVVVIAGGKALIKDTGEVVEGLEPLSRTIKFDVKVL